jgi:hypothetical protein
MARAYRTGSQHLKQPLQSRWSVQSPITVTPLDLRLAISSHHFITKPWRHSRTGRPHSLEEASSLCYIQFHPPLCQTHRSNMDCSVCDTSRIATTLRLGRPDREPEKRIIVSATGLGPTGVGSLLFFSHRLLEIACYLFGSIYALGVAVAVAVCCVIA